MTAQTVYDPATAARRGARLLDRLLPGWVQWVNTSWLDMQSERRCVLGQLNPAYQHDWGEAGGYTLAANSLYDYLGTDAEPFLARNGFYYESAARGYNRLVDHNRTYSKLTTAWVDEIWSRRG